MTIDEKIEALQKVNSIKNELGIHLTELDTLLMDRLRLIKVNEILRKNLERVESTFAVPKEFNCALKSQPTCKSGMCAAKRKPIKSLTKTSVKISGNRVFRAKK